MYTSRLLLMVPPIECDLGYRFRRQTLNPNPNHDPNPNPRTHTNPNPIFDGSVDAKYRNRLDGSVASACT